MSEASSQTQGRFTGVTASVVNALVLIATARGLSLADITRATGLAQRGFTLRHAAASQRAGAAPAHPQARAHVLHPSCRKYLLSAGPRCVA